MAHVVGFEEFAEFVLHEVEFLGGVIDLGVEFSDVFALDIDLFVDLFALGLKPDCDFVDLVQVLVLLFYQVVLQSIHRCL